MTKMLTFTAFVITIFAASAFPATENGKVDKNVNEVSINLVTTASAVEAEKEKKNTVQPQVSVSVGGTIGVSVPGEDSKTPRPLFPVPPPPPPKNPNAFSRLIDDIFQIELKTYEFLDNQYKPFAIDVKRVFCDYLPRRFTLFLTKDFPHFLPPKCPIAKIPITVLQSVSKLLTNPFTQHNKEKDDATA